MQLELKLLKRKLNNRFSKKLQQTQLGHSDSNKVKRVSEAAGQTLAGGEPRPWLSIHELHLDINSNRIKNILISNIFYIVTK